MTKKQKLELFIEVNKIDERDAKRLHGLLPYVFWKRNFDFFLGHDSFGKEFVSTAIDKDANNYHVCWLTFPRG